MPCPPVSRKRIIAASEGRSVYARERNLFGDERSACAVLSYDYTMLAGKPMLAGTQGALGHRKKDRLFELMERMRLPTVLFAEGGGGRPGGASTCRYGGIGANRDLERQLGEATSAAAAAVAG